MKPVRFQPEGNRNKRDECAIFDMDGVLVDTAPFHLEAWDIFGRKHGKDCTREFFFSHFGMKNNEIFPELFGPIDARQIQAYSDEKESLFRDCIRGRIKPMDGVVELIAALHQDGFGIGIGSSAPRDNVHFIVKEIGIQPFLSGLITGDDVDRGKPDPSIFLGAARACNAKYHDCVVFEDAPVGVQAAKAAGMACVAITTTTEPENLRLADLVVRSFVKVTVDPILNLIEANRGRVQK